MQIPQTCLDKFCLRNHGDGGGGVLLEDFFLSKLKVHFRVPLAGPKTRTGTQGKDSSRGSSEEQTLAIWWKSEQEQRSQNTLLV